jgi:hypothetical protein
MHKFNYVRQTEMHTAKLLVPETSALEFEIAIDKLKSHRQPDIYQIRAELNKAGEE